MRVSLREVAYTRSGDKSDTSNVGVVPYRPDDLAWLERELTVDRVREAFSGLVVGDIRRYVLPGIHALNFVMEHALGGGVSRSLNLDAHGKSWGNLMLSMEVEAPQGWSPAWPEVSAHD
ncbi:MAG: hypothetical protein C7B45_01170 [Sulfobacillus acidophilus]|uniref:AtuA-like ferredoxin-fold domain-containing protein n=1 Tax=Sulfobacillus acidophilus TaxID=53633 RepID=A0A2T2WNU8_9FIRM|nr:MAG: hypothetical protein C7B45_01170 [Sulfobacillus acidophilus]